MQQDADTAALQYTLWGVLSHNSKKYSSKMYVKGPVGHVW